MESLIPVKHCSKLLSLWWSGSIVCAQSCPTLCNPKDCSHQASLPMGFPRQEYWSGLPFPSPGDLPSPGITPVSPALAGGFYHWATREHHWVLKATLGYRLYYCKPFHRWGHQSEGRLSCQPQITWLVSQALCLSTFPRIIPWKAQILQQWLPFTEAAFQVKGSDHLTLEISLQGRFYYFFFFF